MRQDKLQSEAPEEIEGRLLRLSDALHGSAVRAPSAPSMARTEHLSGFPKNPPDGRMTECLTLRLEQRKAPATQEGILEVCC